MNRMISATEYLDRTAMRLPDKVAFRDDNRAITFRELQSEARRLAVPLVEAGIRRQPVIVYLEKSVECLPAFLGAAYSGNFYSPVDTKMPEERIRKITQTLIPAAVITDRAHAEEAAEFAGDARIVIYEDAMEQPEQEELVRRATAGIHDTDILYVLFTSGSTGMPKGVSISHRALIDFAEWADSVLEIDESSVFASQAPFYFSFSIYEIWLTLRNGAETVIVPRMLFAFPGALMPYLQEHGVTAMVWVPSALNFISMAKALNSPHLDTLRTIVFGGEVMPVKHLNRWIEAYPDVTYMNGFGPTEVTDTCLYYIVNRKFEEGTAIPAGIPCANKDVMLLDEKDQLISPDDLTAEGEICVRGSGLSSGYYNNPEKTREVFVQNPVQTAYPEIIYRTGDLGRYNKYGEIEYICRKDFQIKYQGHRIELGEIETAASAAEGVESVCCLYNAEKARITLFYTGPSDKATLTERLKEQLPEYMLPKRTVHLDRMPLNLNGKVDRQELKKQL